MSKASPGASGKSDPAAGAHQQLVDAIPTPAALLSSRGVIRALNKAWHDQARPGALVAPTDKAGQDHLHDLREEKGFHRTAGKILGDALEKVVEGDRTARYEYDLGDEHERWEATMSRIELDGDDYVLLVHRDISAERQLVDMGRRMARLLMQSESLGAIARDRDRLLATAEQEFHAPLTPIRLQMHLLQAGSLGDLTERQSKALATIDRNVKRWWHLQERLMAALTSMESASHPVETRDMSALLDEAMQPFQERALKAGVRLRVDRSNESLPVTVDPRGMVQSIMMLLDHAVRETPAGGLVWARLRPLGDTVEFGVQDQDPEMDPQLAAGLLEENSLAQTSWGSGLLHVQTVVERHGGEIELTCRGPGQGLEVTLRLPQAISTGSQGVEAPEAATQHA